MPSVSSVKLNNGNTIPIIGTGAAVFGAEAVAQAKHWLGAALKNGYRHIDTAAMYPTEEVVGQAIRESGIPREELFLTTKAPWNLDEKHTLVHYFEQSLQKLGVDYVDLYLLHWPQTLAYEEGRPFAVEADGLPKVVDHPNFSETYAEMEKLLSTGKVKAIGVSNFSIKTLEELLKTAKVVPAVNQVELHPYLAQNDLRDYSVKKGIVLTAYTPSGREQVRNDPLIVELAAKYKVTSTQIILAWHIARGTVIVPKSADETRQRENINLPALDEEDVNKINGLDRGERICNKANEHGKVYGWTLERLGW